MTIHTDPVPSDARTEFAEGPKLDPTVFELPLAIPANPRSLHAFIKHLMPRLEREAVAGATAILEEASKNEPWKSMSPLEKLVAQQALFYGAEESVVNAMWHGILGVEAYAKMAVMNKSEIECQVSNVAKPAELSRDERDTKVWSIRRAAFRELLGKLQDPQTQSGFGNLIIQIVGESIQLTISDSGKFPRYAECLREAEIRFEDPGRYPHGRGIAATKAFFDSAVQDPASGAITYTLTLEGMRERFKKNMG